MSNNVKRVRLSENIAPAFHPVHKSIKLNECSSYWLKGGRGSTKSSFAAIEIVLGIISDPNANAIVLRKVQDTIRTSVLQTILWAIGKLELQDYFSHTKSPAEVTYKPTGQKIIFKGLDDPLKLKSIKMEKGYFKFLWFEEAAEFHGIEEIRNVEQSVLRGGEKFVEFLTYNPPNDPAAWVNRECDVVVDGRMVHTSSYLDVPPEWLGSKFIADAETLKRNDPLKYEHEYMGKAVGRAEQIIFHGKWKVKEFITPHYNELYQSRLFFGADWGFANDPTTLIRSFIMQERGEMNLYIEYEAGGVGIEMEEIAALFDTIPESRRWKIWADCARPETISYVERRGFNVEASPKWSGSVEDGIEYMRSFNNIFIHPRCVKTIEEFKTYSYKVDKNTQLILPVVANGQQDHFIDAQRYALSEYISSGVSILDVL